MRTRPSASVRTGADQYASPLVMSRAPSTVAERADAAEADALAAAAAAVAHAGEPEAAGARRAPVR